MARKKLTVEELTVIGMYVACGGNCAETGRKLYPNIKNPSSKINCIIERPLVKAALANNIRNAMDYADVTTKDVMKSLKENMNADITEAFDKNWRLKKKEDIPGEVRRSISQINVSDKGISIKMTDKKGIAELAGKSQAMFTDKHDINDKSSLADFVEEVEKRKLDRPRISDLQN